MLISFRHAFFQFLLTGSSHVKRTVSPLFLVPETNASAEERGLVEIEGKALSMGVLKELIELVRRHVAIVSKQNGLKIPSFGSPHAFARLVLDVEY